MAVGFLHGQRGKKPFVMPIASYTGTQTTTTSTNPITGNDRAYMKITTGGNVSFNMDCNYDIWVVSAGGSGSKGTTNTILAYSSSGGGGSGGRRRKVTKLKALKNTAIPVVVGAANYAASSVGSETSSGTGTVEQAGGGSPVQGGSDKVGNPGGDGGFAFMADHSIFNNESFRFGGGGGSGSWARSGYIAGGAGGKGGGAYGAASTSAGSSASANTGGGGGGGANVDGTAYGDGGSGGSGVVFIRWGDWSDIT